MVAKTTRYIIDRTKRSASVIRLVLGVLVTPFCSDEGRSRIRICLEIITLLLLLLILGTYYHANQLTQKALELNQKQLMASHVPWLSIHDVSFDEDNRRISYYVQNRSNSPALQVRARIDFFDKNKPLIKNESGFEYKSHIIPPQTIQPDHYRMSPANFEYTRAAFYEDKIHFQITAQYEDVFGRKFSVIQSFHVSKDGKKTIIPLDATITGIDQLK